VHRYLFDSAQALKPDSSKSFKLKLKPTAVIAIVVELKEKSYLDSGSAVIVVELKEKIFKQEFQA
jgi:hypothetical protein